MLPGAQAVQCAHGAEVMVVDKGQHTGMCEIREKLWELHWPSAPLIRCPPDTMHACSRFVCPCASVHVMCSCDHG